MSDETDETNEIARAADRARMMSVAGVHFVMVMGALTLWGAADAWAQASGWVLAQVAALGGAVRMPVRELPDGALIAVVSDPEGNAVGLFQPGAASA